MTILSLSGENVTQAHSSQFIVLHVLVGKNEKCAKKKLYNILMDQGVVKLWDKFLIIRRGTMIQFGPD